MKAAHKTQITALFTLFCQVAAWGQGYSPEAWDLIEAVERRIAAARAGQATLDALLAALAPGESCQDWAAESFWKRDPDLRAALKEVCPDLTRPPRKRPARALRVDLGAYQDVRPAAAGQPDPSLSGSLRGSSGGLRLTASPGDLRRRQAFLEGPSWKAQAGSLDLGGLPHLAFLTGRRAFPGGGWFSGLEGPLAAASSSLDGLAFSGEVGGLAAAAFGAWNRRPSGEDPEEPRQDALTYSLAAAWEAGGWQGTLEAVHLRLEVPDREAGQVLAGGAEIRRGNPGLRLALAGSGLRPGAAAPEEGPGAASSGGGRGRPGGASSADASDASRAISPETGAYAEIAWEEEKPGGYLLEAWQATPGWASPLAARPAWRRDTAEPGFILPGRGEGGTRLRSRLGLLEAEGMALGLRVMAAAGWALENVPVASDGSFLAGEGLASLVWESAPWISESSLGSGWRREGMPAAGTRVTLGQRVAWERHGWRAGGSWSRREMVSGVTWPAALEISWRARGGGRWQALLAAADAWHPARDWRLGLDQAWPLGSGLRISHALRLPVEAGELREDFGYRVKLEFGGR